MCLEESATRTILLVELWTPRSAVSECYDCFRSGAANTCDRRQTCVEAQLGSSLEALQQGLSGTRFSDVNRERPLCVRVLGYAAPSCDALLRSAERHEVTLCAANRSPILPVQAGRIQVEAECAPGSGGPLFWSCVRGVGEPPTGGVGVESDAAGAPPAAGKPNDAGPPVEAGQIVPCSVALTPPLSCPPGKVDGCLTNNAPYHVCVGEDLGGPPSQ